MSTKLNEKQLIAVHLLASGVKASVIANQLGMREETLSRWRQIDEFKKALEDAYITTEDIDYINAHGTSTPAGDIVEIEAISNLFEKNIPFISSTKSLSGHSLGAAGVHESIFSLIMLKEGFLVGSANIENLDEEMKVAPILLENKDFQSTRVMSNSFGFGGTNATLIFEKV